MSGRSRQVSLSALAAKTALSDATDDRRPSNTTYAAPESSPDTADRSSTSSPASPASVAAEPVAAASGARRRRATRAQPVPGEWVRYDEYERKEARLRPDQYGRLSTTSRALNRARRGRGERITENTLIRVAIDLLLARDHEIRGATEVEIRRSLGL
jgi:hypothetical protein